MVDFSSRKFSDSYCDTENFEIAKAIPEE